MATKKKTKRLTAKQRRMQRAIKYMTEYMDTYASQYGCLDYTDATFIDDVLYGLGVALDQNYEYATGFDAFKDVLREHLGRE